MAISRIDQVKQLSVCLSVSVSVYVSVSVSYVSASKASKPIADCLSDSIRLTMGITLSQTDWKCGEYPGDQTRDRSRAGKISYKLTCLGEQNLDDWFWPGEVRREGYRL